jgi:putative hemolysin
VDGLLNLDEFAEQTGVELPEGPYETVAGYVLATLGELPGVGAEVEVNRYKLTVTELDGRRIARVRVRRAGDDGAAGEKSASPAPGEKAASPAPGGKAASPPSG